MTSNDHVAVARQLLADGKPEEAQTQVLLKIADQLDNLNTRVISLEETITHQISTLTQVVEKCLSDAKRGDR